MNSKTSTISERNSSSKGHVNKEVYPKASVAWATVIILSFTYMFSYIDRQILVLLIEPIKDSFEISDTQVSLLTGFSFAAVYALMGIPMGRAADLWIRKYVIIIGITMWSSLTIFCGFAKNFFQMFIARMGVGLGEAALTPTAYTMISDIFPPHKLAIAMSVFSLGGIAAGSAISLLLGGFVIGQMEEIGAITIPILGELQPWQLVLVCVGGLSLLMTIPMLFVPEPRRQITAEFNLKFERYGKRSFRAVLIYLNENRAFYAPFIVGSCLANIFAYGGIAWIPSYFIRVHEWEASTTGLVLGATFVIPAIVGGLLSGLLSDHLYSRGFRSAPLFIYTASLAMLGPVIVCFIYISDIKVKLTLLACLYFLLTVYAVLFPTIIQLATPSEFRGQMSAIHLMAINLIGPGLGPTIVALVTDFVFQDNMAIGHSIAIVGLAAYGFATITMLFALRPFKEQIAFIGGNPNE
mgnify:CR=1 FL=1|jgi:MFS family permease